MAKAMRLRPGWLLRTRQSARPVIGDHGLAMKSTVNESERKSVMNKRGVANATAGQGVKALLDGWLGGTRAREEPAWASLESDTIVACAARSGAVYRYRVASDLAARERVYRFAHEIYSAVSLAQDDGTGMVVSPYDAGPETFTLLAEDESGSIVGTVSLVFDSERGLPCDEIYWLETGRLRAENRSMAEVTRLALRKDMAASREVLLRLFNLIYIYARRVRGYTDFLIEVHPRHVKYYERTLGFERSGSEQKCPRVGGAPAVLGRLDLAVPEREVRRVGGLGETVKGRSLYPRFWSADREPGLASAMAAAWRPMPPHEARYFGVANGSPSPGGDRRQANAEGGTL